MRLCVAAAFAQRVALREQIYLMDRLSSAAPVLERILPRERALFRRFWHGQWVYEPGVSLEAALGAEGVKQVQFNWNAVRDLTRKPPTELDTPEAAEERHRLALELVGDCVALAALLADPKTRDLEPTPMWNAVKKERAVGRTAIEAVRRGGDPAEQEILVRAGISPERLAAYLGAVEEAMDQLDPDEARDRVIALTETDTPTDEIEVAFKAGVDPVADLNYADLLVRAGRTAEAHVLLGRRRDKAGLARRLVLDHARRLTWADYPAFLDSIADPELEPLVQALRDAAMAAGRGAGRERLGSVRDESLAVGLPGAYDRALDAGHGAVVAQPHRALAAWRSAEALAAAGAPSVETAGAALLVVGPAAPTPEWLAHARALAAAGVRLGVVSSEPDLWTDTPVAALADAETVAAFLDEAGPTAVTLGAQFVSPDHVWAWAGVAEPGAAVRAWTDHVADHVASPLAFEFAYQAAQAEAGLIGAGRDLDAAALVRDPAAYIARRFVGRPDRRIATVLTESVAFPREAAPTLVVFYDAPEAPEIDYAGPVRAISVAAPEGEPAPKTLAELLPALADVAPGVPVVFISQDMPYPPNYARNAAHQFADLGGLDLSFLAIRRSTHLEGSQPVAASTAGLSPLACLASICLSTESLRRIAAATPARLSTVLDMEEPGFLFLPLFDALYIDKTEERIRRFLAAEALRGVRAVSGGKPLSEAALGALPEPARRVLAPVIRKRAYYRALADHLAEDDFSILDDRSLENRAEICRELLDLGYLRAASEVFTRSISVAPREMGRSKALRPFINLASELGQQQAFADHHRFIVGDLVRTRPTDMGPFFEVLATVMTQAELDLTVLTALAGSKEGKSDRGLLRFLDAANKYASPEALNWVIFEVLTRVPRETLNRPAVQDLLRGVGQRAAFTPDQIEALGLAASFTRVILETPLAEKVRTAVASGDWPGLADAINTWISRNLPLADLIKEIRTYSQPLSASRLAEMVTYYRVYDTPDARMMFASVIGDQTYLKQALQTREGDASVIARARTGQFDWLEARLDELGEPIGVATPRFDPSSVQDVFASVIATREPELKIRGRLPKVTAVMTLFNPDMDLLPYAIDSVLAQEGVEVELVVIDDASEPDSAAAIERMVAGRPGVIFERSAVNTGPYVGRNRALELSRGKFVAIQDGDDVSHPARFRTQVAALQAAGPQAMLVTAGHMRIDGGGRPQLEHDFTLVGDGTMTSMFRREAFGLVGGFARVRSRGDVEMRERIRAALGSGALLHVHYPMVYCNAAPDTLSNRTARSTPQYLSLFRTNFARQHRHLRQAVAMGERITPPDAAVPARLRP